MLKLGRAKGQMGSMRPKKLGPAVLLEVSGVIDITGIAGIYMKIVSSCPICKVVMLRLSLDSPGERELASKDFNAALQLSESTCHDDHRVTAQHLDGALDGAVRDPPSRNAIAARCLAHPVLQLLSDGHRLSTCTR